MTTDGSATRATAEHHVVIDGRRWRATDPELPDRFRSELVAELMDSRRAVAAARRADDADAERAARRRVQDAKVALGERGHPWWESDTADTRAPRIRSTVRALAHHRGPDGSICPSDVARTLGGTPWRPLMDEVRDAARQLAGDGEVHLTSGSTVLDPAQPLRGAIRIRDGSAPGGAAG